MIKLNNITYQYQSETFHFAFSVEQGELLSIVGPSGAGKSTLLHLIAGFLMPQSGSLWLANQESTDLLPQERPIAMLFQENNLLMHLSVERNIALGLTPNFRLSTTQKSTVLALAEEMGIADLLPRQPETLSGGQRQRVALARCLIQQRPILLLDEPFSSLDPAKRHEMLHLVKQLCFQHHITALMVSHHLDDAKLFAERVLVLDQGKCIFDGAIAHLYHSAHPAAQKLGIQHQIKK